MNEWVKENNGTKVMEVAAVGSDEILWTVYVLPFLIEQKNARLSLCF